MSNITNLQARAEELAINVWIGTPAQIEERKKDFVAANGGTGIDYMLKYMH